ncbi:FIG015547: peptidase, M16 family [hydrothermal vent metagenome]|uniref:FIG015547: peptidase, M16 family n=1 Tax=hydrothermal vent metagenome TaxID=652676 RepID=A0A3B1BHN2_9ZZZZ
MRHFIWMFILFCHAVAASAGGKVHEYRLSNGMKVIVKEDHRAPIVVSQVWYKVGSSYEHRGITGVSHVLEHMMFKGTKKHPPGEFSRIIAANGGRENAFTGRDYTAYFQTLSKDRLEVSFEMEADRMRNLILPADEFAKEVEVVKEERRLRTEDKPTSLTYEQFNAIAYRSSPYRNPVIGWMNDLDNMQVEDLQIWYQRWYAPNNATLVVVGDVEPEAVFALAKKHFGPFKAERIIKPKPSKEPEQLGMIRLKVRAPARQPYLLMGYKTPAISTAEEEWEPYALEVLAAVLDGGGSARFARNLVRGQEIAVSAGVSYSGFSRLSGMLMVSGSPADGHSMEELEAALLAELELVKKEPVSQQELARIQAQVIAAKVYEQDTVFYQAMEIGTLETIGLDWRLGEEYVDRLKAVTAEQVQAVAKKYLVENHLTVALLDPLPMDTEKSVSRSTGGHHGR